MGSVGFMGSVCVCVCVCVHVCAFLVCTCVHVGLSVCECVFRCRVTVYTLLHNNHSMSRNVKEAKRCSNACEVPSHVVKTQKERKQWVTRSYGQHTPAVLDNVVKVQRPGRDKSLKLC